MRFDGDTICFDLCSMQVESEESSDTDSSSSSDSDSSDFEDPAPSTPAPAPRAAVDHRRARQQKRKADGLALRSPPPAERSLPVADPEQPLLTFAVGETPPSPASVTRKAKSGGGLSSTEVSQVARYKAKQMPENQSLPERVVPSRPSGTSASLITQASEEDGLGVALSSTAGRLDDLPEEKAISAAFNKYKKVNDARLIAVSQRSAMFLQVGDRLDPPGFYKAFKCLWNGQKKVRIVLFIVTYCHTLLLIVAHYLFGSRWARETQMRS